MAARGKTKWVSRQASGCEIREGDPASGAAQALRRTLGWFLVAVAVLVPLKVTSAEGQHASIPKEVHG